MSKSGCTTPVRTAKGDRLLMLLATDPDHAEVRELMVVFRGIHRKHHPEDEELTDDDVRERIAEWIAGIPKVCPDCHGKSHD